MEFTSDEECPMNTLKDCLRGRFRPEVSRRYPVDLLQSKIFRMKIRVIVYYYISQLYYIYAVVKVQHRQLEFAEQELIFGHESFKYGKLTYAVCTNNGTSNEKICQVIREKTPLSNDTFSCNVTFKVLPKQDNDTEIADQYGIVPFGKDKAVLYIIHKSKRKKCRFNTIQFDGCKVVETNVTVAKFVFSKYNVVIIPYSNSYDVVYPSYMSGYQKITIGWNGEQINGPDGLGYNLWLANFPFILPVSHKSRSKGFVFLRFVYETDEDYDLHLWKPDGSEEALGQHNHALRSIKSVDHDFIGICHDFNNSLRQTRCAQYGADGKLRFETDLISQDNGTIAFIHNVPGGGLFLFGGQPTNETENIDFFIVKLNSTGCANGSLSLGEIELKAEALALTFYKNGDSEYCVSLADYNAIDMNSENCSNPYYIHQTVNCFSDSDFVS